MVPETGLEPARFWHMLLRHTCLPIPPLGQDVIELYHKSLYLNIIYKTCDYKMLMLSYNTDERVVKKDNF